MPTIQTVTTCKTGDTGVIRSILRELSQLSNSLESFVPKTRKLKFLGGIGISVEAPQEQDLSADRVWTIKHNDTSSVPNLVTAESEVIDTMTFDTFGHVQSYTLKTIVAQAVGTAGGDLTGSYPNPNVLWVNGQPTYDIRYLQIANNLSDLADVPTARNNLGLGDVALINTNGNAGQFLDGTGNWSSLNTDDVAEGTNLYYTDVRVRNALSITTVGSSGASTYNPLTGVFNIPIYTAAGLGAPTGSGTLNYLARWSPDGNTLTTGATRDNGSTVSIGAALSANILDIQASTTSGSSYGLILKAGTTSGDWAMRVYDATATTPYLMINGVGNVGIGVAPSAAGVNIRTLTIDGSAGSALQLNYNGSAKGQIYVDATNLNIASFANAGDVIFGNNYFRIFTGGNSAFGSNTNAGYKVDINGTFRGQSTGEFVGSATALNANNTATGYTLKLNTAFFFRQQGAIAGISGNLYASQLFTNSGGGDIEIYSQNVGGGSGVSLGSNSTERFRVRDTYTSVVSGNFLVGTTTNNYRVHVYSNTPTADSARVRFENAGGNQIVQLIGTKSAFSLYTASGQWDYGVDTDGVFKISGSNSSVGDLTTNLRLSIGLSGTVTTHGSITASSAIARGVYVNNTLVAAANNDVLVGLDINPTFTNGAFTGVQNIGLRVNATQVRVGNGVAGGASSAITATHQAVGQAAQYMIGSYTDGSEGQLFIGGGSASFNASKQIYFYTASTNTTLTGTRAMSILPSGNIVMGSSVTDAGYKLDVAGTGRFTGIATFQAAYNAGGGIGQLIIKDGGSVGTDYFTIGYDENGTTQVDFNSTYTTGKYSFRFANVEKASISSAGAFSTTSLTATGLTAGGIPYIGTGGLLSYSSDLLFDATTGVMTLTKVGNGVGRTFILKQTTDSANYSYIGNTTGTASTLITEFGGYVTRGTLSDAVYFSAAVDSVAGDSGSTPAVVLSGRKVTGAPWTSGTTLTVRPVLGVYNYGTSLLQVNANGNFLLNTTTDAGQKLQVSGTSLFSSTMTLTPSSDVVTLSLTGSRTLTAASTNQVWLQVIPTITDNNASNNTFHTYLSVAPSITHNNSISGTNGVITVSPSFTNSGGLDVSSGISILRIAPTFTGQRNVFAKGVYIAATLTGLTGTNGFVAIENTVGNNYFNSTSGSTGIGYASGATLPALFSVNGAFSSSSITATGLTSGRIPLIGTGGLLTDNSKIRYNIVNGTILNMDARTSGEIAAINLLDEGGSATYLSIIKRGTTATGGFSLPAGGAEIIATVTTGSGFAIGTGTGYLAFGTNSTERARFHQTTGNFILNSTTDTGHRLQVNGTSLFTNDMSLINASSYALVYLSAPSGFTSAITFQQAGSTRGYIQYCNSAFGGASRYDMMEFSATAGYSFASGADILKMTSASGIVAYRDLTPSATNTHYLGYTGQRWAWVFAGRLNAGSTYTYSSGTNTNVAIEIDTVINTTGGTNTIRGLYYNPTLTSLTGTTHIAIQTVSGSVIFGSASGNVLIGTTTDAGQRLQVNGTSLFSGNSSFGGRIGVYSGAGAQSGFVANGNSMDIKSNDFSFTAGNISQGGELTWYARMWASMNYTASSGVSNFAFVNINPTLNLTGTHTGTLRGLYYNPTLTSLTGTTHIAIETVSGNNYFGTTSGSVMIGYASGGGTPASYKLDVNGNVRMVSGSSSLWYDNSTFTVDTPSGHYFQIGGNNKLVVGTSSVEVADSYLALPAGTTARPSLRIQAGVAPTSPTNGDVWNDGSNFKVRLGGVTYTLAKTLTASATLDFPDTAAQTSEDLTITVTGAAVGDPAHVGIPIGSYGNTSVYTAFVSAADTVTVRHSNIGTISVNPGSGTFTVTVQKV